MTDVPDAFVDAVVDRMLSPVLIGWTPPQMPAYPGALPVLPQPVYGKSPLVAIAEAMFEARRDVIAAEAIERIDLEQLAEKIANCVLATLANTTAWPKVIAPAGDEMLRNVRRIVADELARRELARIDQSGVTP